MSERRAVSPACPPVSGTLALVVIVVAGCVGASPEPPAAASSAATLETATIGDYEFYLEEDRLRYVGPGGATSAFAIEGSSCRLSRDPDGQVRTHETGASVVFLVVCSEVEAYVGGRPLCDTRVRGVVVADNGVRLPDREQRVGACPPFAWDEQMFIYFVEA